MKKRKKLPPKSKALTTREILAAYQYTLKHNFYFFFKESWHILEPATDLETNWHHKYICDILQHEIERIGRKEPNNGNSDLIINIPFRSTKSTIVSQMLLSWTWIRFPWMRFITSSYASRLSTRDAKKTRDIINSKWYQELFGNSFSWTTDQNVKTEYENDKRGKRFVTSTDSNVTGEGADVLIFDDPNNPREKRDQNFEKVNSTYDDVFYSRLNDDKVGIRIIIQQRIHENDLTGHILSKYPETIRHVVMPAELTEDIHPLELADKYVDDLFWPWKFSHQSLERWAKVLSSTAYTGQLQQNPQAAKGNIIQKEWFTIIAEAELPFNLGNADDYEETEDALPFLGADIWIDGAYTEKTSNDPTGLYACIFFENALYVLISTDKYMELFELLKYFPAFAEANYHGPTNKVFIEPKASGKSLRSMLNKMGFNCIEIENDVVSVGKMARVKDAEPTLESGKIFLIKGEWNKKFIDQCAIFPNGRHDEHVDLLCYSINKYFIKTRERHLSL